MTHGVAVAIPNENYPDTYTLVVDGKEKGFAAVQDLRLSRTLTKACAGKSHLLVKVVWNNEFEMYEISDLA